MMAHKCPCYEAVKNISGFILYLMFGFEVLNSALHKCNFRSCLCNISSENKNIVFAFSFQANFMFTKRFENGFSLAETLKTMWL